MSLTGIVSVPIQLRITVRHFIHRILRCFFVLTKVQHYLILTSPCTIGLVVIATFRLSQLRFSSPRGWSRTRARSAGGAAAQSRPHK
eukprot:2070172-Pleurochrysis_carterae.AAC.1